jgi:hypothetical protein
VVGLLDGVITLGKRAGRTRWFLYMKVQLEVGPPALHRSLPVYSYFVAHSYIAPGLVAWLNWLDSSVSV